jgi:hypothetical protein
MDKSNVEIKEVKSGGDLSKFIKLPWKIYKNDKNWVPPLLIERKEFLDPKRNPFFKHSDVKLYLAYRDRVAVGRIAAIINHAHNEFHEDKVAFFGLFESIDDYIVAYGLLDKAKEFAKENGMEVLRGPANFSTNDEVGLLVDGFSAPPVVMMTYNPKYYMALFDKFGLKKSQDLYAYLLPTDVKVPSRILSASDLIRKRYNVTLKTLNMKDFTNEVARIKQIYNDAWMKNWGFIPMTDDEFAHMAKQMKQIVEPDLVFIAYSGDEPIGFSLTLPNINEILIKLNGRLLPTGIFKLLYFSYVKKIIKGVRVITMGLTQKFQKKGIDNLFHIENIRIAHQKGYKWGELSWVLEDNIMMNRVAELLKAKLYKKYRIYDMEI